MSGMARTGRGRGRARAEVAVARVLEKRLGALPVVAQFGRRLRIAEVVDELCPVRQVALISHGEVIEALVANRLTAPAPLVQVEAWAAAMAVNEVYGIEPHLLNDDRLGRALDAIAPHLDEVTGAMTALKKIAGPRTFLLVGDSKLISWANATAMAAGQVAFVAPLAASRVPAGLFAALPSGAGTEVDYTARRDAGKPAAARGTYRVLEDDGMDIRGPRASDPVVHLRRILVYSSANAAGQAKARALKLTKAAGELDKLVRTAGTRFHPTEDAVAARVRAIAANRRVGRYRRAAIPTR